MSNLMKVLVRGLHNTIGITTPKPEQEGVFVFVWMGVIVGMALFTIALVFLFMHFMY